VNAAVLDKRGIDAQRLGDIERVTAERHGAIRVGSADELSQVARVFAAFGMYPVGFYDLRNGDRSGVPVISTAFRPIDQAELGRNPFRVFTSMLAADDSRYFDEDTRAQLTRFLDNRELFPAELLGLADRAGHPDTKTDRSRRSSDQDHFRMLRASSDIRLHLAAPGGTPLHCGPLPARPVK
jgi:uncharacterized glyoxalase superfamily metalloenzyme YdcJ